MTDEAAIAASGRIGGRKMSNQIQTTDTEDFMSDYDLSDNEFDILYDNMFRLYRELGTAGIEKLTKIVVEGEDL